MKTSLTTVAVTLCSHVYIHWRSTVMLTACAAAVAAATASFFARMYVTSLAFDLLAGACFFASRSLYDYTLLLELRSQLQTLKQTNLSLSETTNTLRSQLNTLSTSNVQLQETAESLRNEVSSLTNHLTSTTEQLTTTSVEYRTTLNDLQKTRSELVETSTSFSTLVTNLSESQISNIQALEKCIETLKTQQAFLCYLILVNHAWAEKAHTISHNQNQQLWQLFSSVTSPKQ